MNITLCLMLFSCIVSFPSGRKSIREIPPFPFHFIIFLMLSLLWYQWAITIYNTIVGSNTEKYFLRSERGINQYWYPHFLLEIQMYFILYCYSWGQLFLLCTVITTKRFVCEYRIIPNSMIYVLTTNVQQRSLNTTHWIFTTHTTKPLILGGWPLDHVGVHHVNLNVPVCQAKVSTDLYFLIE